MGVLCVIVALFCGAWFVNQRETVGGGLVTFLAWSVGGGIVCMLFFAIAYHLEAMADIRDSLCEETKPQAEPRPIEDKPNEPKNRSNSRKSYIALCPHCGLLQKLNGKSCIKCGRPLSSVSAVESETVHPIAYEQLSACPVCGVLQKIERNSCIHCGVKFADADTETPRQSAVQDGYIACPSCGLKQQPIRPNCVKCGAKLSNASESADKKGDL